MFNKLGNKLLFAYAAILGVLVVVLFLFINGLIYTANIDTLKREMDEKANFIDLVLKERTAEGKGNSTALIAETKAISSIVGLRVTIVDFSGAVIADSEVADLSTLDNHLHRAEIEAASSAGKGDSVRHSATLNLDTMYYAKKSDVYYVRLAKSLKDIDKSLSGIRKQLVTFLLCSVCVGLILVWVTARRMSKPIRETYRFATDFSEGKFDRRIRNYSDDEVGSVQRALNRLADTVVEKVNGLEAERSKLVTTFETLSDGIAVIRPDRTIEFANTSFRNFYSPDLSVDGRRSFEVIRSRKINARIEEALAKETALRFDEEFADGRILEIYLSPVREGEKLSSMLLVSHDVTEQKRIERIKSDLVGNMSHELKTPVTIMKGYLETLHNHLEDREMSELLITRAIENADRQNSLINDILKLHMIESSSEMVREKIDLAEIIGSCVKILSAKAFQRKITVNVEVSCSAIFENGNRFLAEEVLFNLIDNAINYNNPEGSVTVLVSENSGKTVCSVRDTGIGIPQESISRIFERFYRVDKSRSRATGGTGLGLSIVKHAADLLGWRIQVQSDQHGTEFRVLI